MRRSRERDRERVVEGKNGKYKNEILNYPTLEKESASFVSRLLFCFYAQVLVGG